MPNKKQIGEASTICNDWVDKSSDPIEKVSSESEDTESIHEMDENSITKSCTSKLIPSGPEKDDDIETRENTFQENL